MDNQKPVLQIQPKQNVHYEYMIAINSGLIIPFIKINTYYSLSNSTILFFILSLLFSNLYYLCYIKKLPKMNFYSNGKIKYNEEIFDIVNYLGITTTPDKSVVLVNKDKFSEDLTVFDIPLNFINFNDNLEFNEVIKLKKQIAKVTKLPIFEPCDKFLLREKLTLWKEQENIDYLIAYKNNQREIILYRFLIAIIGFIVFLFSNYDLFFISAIILIVSILYLLLNKYRFYITTITTSEIKISNEKILYNNQEIALNDIKKIEIKDIYAQKYYVYSRLNIELNNGEIVKLFVSTPQVRNPKKLREFLSDKLPNKLIDEDKIF